MEMTELENAWLMPEISRPVADRWSDYYRDIASTLLAPIADRQVESVCMVCCPSFRTEWSLQLIDVQSDPNPGYYLVSSAAASSIWESGATTEVLRDEARVSKQLAEAINVAWRTMLERVRPIQLNVRDGEEYHFRCDGGVLSGYTWSPDEGTPAHRLTSLSKLLYRYPKAPEAERAELTSRIMAAAKWFKALR